jgi:hypothetical protein
MMHALVLALALAQAADARSLLASQRIDLELEATPLADALGVLRAHTGLNFVLDPAAVADHESAPVTLRLKDVSVRTALKIMLGSRGLTLTERRGILVVVPKEKLERQVVTRVYDVRDLLRPIEQFAGPKVELVDADANSISTGILIIEIDRKEVYDEEFLTTLIPQATGGDSWTSNEEASISVVNGSLVVTQSARVQKEVAELLRLLRQFK